jgi:tetratricopeptide (TPR) repeat protein
MSKRRKIILGSGIIVTGLLAIIFLMKFNLSNRYRHRIPDISASSNIKQPVRRQILDAFEIAYRNPSAENLGQLGTIYHSSANYAEAAQCYRLAIERKKSDWIWNYYSGYLNMEMGNSELPLNISPLLLKKIRKITMPGIIWERSIKYPE